MTHEENLKLADLLFPNIKTTPEGLEERYPKRNLPENSIVTRFAPSPTGFIHIGGIYASLISERIAHQSGGIFYLRIEDTDKKREINEGILEIINSLKNFSINYDEGPIDSNNEIGNYGPYSQSKRKDIYHVFAKLLVQKGYAYPCFCSEEELENIRKKQESQNIFTGYYGEWAYHRNFSFNDYIKELNSGKKYVLRLKSPGNINGKIQFKDLLRGKIEFPENFHDIVILKSDGLPTYHFAHIVDDHLMRTTHVIRGEEWLSSVPLHLQLFQIMEWQPPLYLHIAPIMKLEDNSKRKLSKRKDPEAAVSYYIEKGYPSNSVIEYLINLINSNFEDWRKANPNKDYKEFKIEINKMSQSGALFDINKLNDISKNVIANMTAEEVYNLSLNWAKNYDPTLENILIKNKEYVIKIFSIDRYTDKKRKDITKWEDIKYFIQYFFDELFNPEYKFPENISKEDIKKLISEYLEIFDYNDDNIKWFEKIKILAEKNGFAINTKQWKQNPHLYKGNISDVSNILRIAITGRNNTPDLYEIIKLIGENRVKIRLRNCLERLYK